MTKEFGHLWLQTGAILVTKKQRDAPYLWANIKLPTKATRGGRASP